MCTNGYILWTVTDTHDCTDVLWWFNACFTFGSPFPENIPRLSKWAMIQSFVIHVVQALQNVVHKIQNMTSYQLAAPTLFDFSQPASWSSWLQCFERFRLASKLSDDSEENQVYSMIYAMGKQAEEYTNHWASEARMLRSTTQWKPHLWTTSSYNTMWFSNKRTSKGVCRVHRNQSTSLSLISTHSLNIASLAPWKMSW